MSTIYYDASRSESDSMFKVFAWMFYAILITAVTAFGLPFLLIALDLVHLYNTILIVGVVAVLILSFVSNMIIMRTSSKPLAITMFTLFAMAMGVWISPLVIAYDLSTIIYSLFITSVVFGVMAIYGAVTKKDLSSFGSFLFMALIGVIILSIFNMFFANGTVNWILSYVVLGIYIGFVAFDIQRVKRLAQQRQLTLNVSLIMALNIYVDFVYIFIRIVQLVGSNRD